MRLTMMNLFRIVWLIACFIVLAWTFIACGREANETLPGECSLLAAFIMAFLTFPVGLLWWLLISAAGYFFFVVGIENWGGWGNCALGVWGWGWGGGGGGERGGFRGGRVLLKKKR